MPLRCKNCSCGVNGKPGLPGCFYMEDDYEKDAHPEADCRL